MALAASDENILEVTATPLTIVEFDAAMRQLGWEGDKLALAVSGGPDSMALVVCAHQWAAENGTQLIAFTLDHALRAESASEATQVQRWLQHYQIEHHILRWEHPPITSAVQQQARQARYELMAQSCQARGIRGLALGHQLEDQAETVLLRFAKGSGIDGLAAMRPVTDCADIVLLRPFLTMSKARLIATCVAAGQPYITDPSNLKAAYARGRLRAATDVLAAEGLTAERLADLAARDCYANRLLAQAVFWQPSGYAEINLPRLLAEPAEIRLRVLRQVLEQIGGKRVPLRHAAVQELDNALQQPHVSQRTLHGCAIRAFDGVCRVVRELAAITECAPLAAGETRLWDGRFRVTLASHTPAEFCGLQCAALGLQSHDVLERVAAGLRHAVPLGQVRATLPALWRGETLVAAPFYGSGAEWFHIAPIIG
jgi:tRNA(Ile)-lysidine synthase